MKKTRCPGRSALGGAREDTAREEVHSAGWPLWPAARPARGSVCFYLFGCCGERGHMTREKVTVGQKADSIFWKIKGGNPPLPTRPLPSRQAQGGQCPRADRWGSLCPRPRSGQPCCPPVCVAVQLLQDKGHLSHFPLVTRETLAGGPSALNHGEFRLQNRPRLGW